jgi:uncharacterized protein
LPRCATSPDHSPNALPALAIFARAPIPGRAKTRLIPLLGPRGAADFHAALVSDTLQKVNALAERADPYFFLAGEKFPVASSLSDYTLKKQSGNDLGERLDNAFKTLLKNHGSALVMGTDSPPLTRRVLLTALEKLRASDAVLGPCPDGGFYLIGLRRHVPGLFDGVRWGSESAFEDMRASLSTHGVSCRILEAIDDVDRPGDVERIKDEFIASAAARRKSPSAWRFLREFFALQPIPKKRKKQKPASPTTEI